jgi:dynamin 1-like protein
MEKVVGLVNRLQYICTQLGDTAGNSILVDKLSSIVVVGGQVRSDSAPIPDVSVWQLGLQMRDMQAAWRS